MISNIDNGGCRVGCSNVDIDCFLHLFCPLSSMKLIFSHLANNNNLKLCILFYFFLHNC